MSAQRSDPAVSVATIAAGQADADVVGLPVFDDDDLGDVVDLEAASGGEVARVRDSGVLRFAAGETLLLRTDGAGWQPRHVLLVGAGPPGRASVQRLREAAAAAARAALRHRIERLAFVCRKSAPADRAVQAVAEGILLGSFEDRRYKTENGRGWSLGACQVIAPAASGVDLAAAVERGRTLAAAANVARELANEPSNVLTPAVFAGRAAALMEDVGVGVEILDEQGVAERQMGLLLGVARGSLEPPRVVVMRYEPVSPVDDAVLGLVGKGVTFDSGGISIKPADGMERMKGDMAGGAAVIGAMRALAQLRAPRRVIGVVPMTENMPSGRATKPGDILTGASGTTVEVINTDAEGRLILGDALWYARELGATHLVDVATLTGACVVALGNVASGLFGRPDDWTTTVRRASERAGEPLWPLPVGAEYRELLRSDMADLVNSAGRAGGACTAAAFLEAFTGGQPWAHVDIAGTAWAEDNRKDTVKGSTGVMVRTLAELALDEATW